MVLYMTPLKLMKISDIPPQIEPTSFRIAEELLHPPLELDAEVSRWTRLRAWLGAQTAALFDGCAKSSLADVEAVPPSPQPTSADGSVDVEVEVQAKDPTWDILRPETTVVLRRQAAARRV
jgi:hypothetical protein